MLRSCILIASLLAAGTAAAQETRHIGDFEDWGAYAYEERGEPVCYIASKPTASKGTAKGRGDAYAMVTHRAADKIWGEVSIVGGYDYQKQNGPTVKIGGDSFDMFAKGDTAWVHDGDDPRLVAAMKRGLEMVVTGTSSRGSVTTDTYSLQGFTKAYAAIDEACGRR